MSNETVTKTVQSILADRNHETPTFIPTRYPFTYAYDFYKAHGYAFGETEHGDWQDSRGVASGRVQAYAERTGQRRTDVVIAMADGYLAEHGYQVTEAEKIDALTASILDAWKTFGFSERPVIEDARRRAVEALADQAAARTA